MVHWIWSLSCFPLGLCSNPQDPAIFQSLSQLSPVLALSWICSELRSLFMHTQQALLPSHLHSSFLCFLRKCFTMVYFLLICISIFLHVCICTSCMPASCTSRNWVHQIPWKQSYGPGGCWETNLGIPQVYSLCKRGKCSYPRSWLYSALPLFLNNVLVVNWCYFR